MNPGVKNKNYARKVLQDLTGMVFNQLTVIMLAEITAHKRTKWECLCTCGNETVVFASALKSGGTKSCGCLHRETIRKMLTTHGHSQIGNKSLTYVSWTSMKNRCLSVANPSYPDYGGRGISICERWVNSFENFLSDMGERPSKEYSLGRFPDVNGDYGPTNCRWETTGQQSRCKRNTVWVEFKGERMVAADFKRKLGIKSQRFLHLLKTMSPEQVADYYKNKNK